MRSDFVDLFLSALSRCDIDSQDKVTLSILKHFHKRCSSQLYEGVGSPLLDFTRTLWVSGKLAAKATEAVHRNSALIWWHNFPVVSHAGALFTDERRTAFQRKSLACLGKWKGNVQKWEKSLTLRSLTWSGCGQGNFSAWNSECVAFAWNSI